MAAFEEGREARRKPGVLCPYTPESEEAVAWEKGRQYQKQVDYLDAYSSTGRKLTDHNTIYKTRTVGPSELSYRQAVAKAYKRHVTVDFNALEQRILAAEKMAADELIQLQEKPKKTAQWRQKRFGGK